jgi:hypothetical protein
MSNSRVRTADEQAREYVERDRLRQRRAAADRAAVQCLVDLRNRYGFEHATGAWVRLTGLMLIEGASRPLVQRCCRVLAKCIAISVWRRVLTRHPMLH